MKIIYYLKSQPIYKHPTQWQLPPTNQQPPLQPPPTHQPPQTTPTITESSNKFQIQKPQQKKKKKPTNQPTKKIENKTPTQTQPTISDGCRGQQHD